MAVMTASRILNLRAVSPIITMEPNGYSALYHIELPLTNGNELQALNKE